MYANMSLMNQVKRIDRTATRQTFPLDLAERCEIDQVTDRLARKTHGIEQLAFMLIGECLHGFELNDDVAANDQIGNLSSLEFAILVEDCQWLLRDELDSAQLQFEFETLLVDFFK